MLLLVGCPSIAHHAQHSVHSARGEEAKKVLISAKRGGLAITEFFFLRGGGRGGGVSKIGGSGIFGGGGGEWLKFF